MRVSERNRAVIAYKISVMFECITELMPEAFKAVSYAQRRPQKFFRGGGGEQATYQLFIGSNKTWQLQIGFC